MIELSSPFLFSHSALATRPPSESGSAIENHEKKVVELFKEVNTGRDLSGVAQNPAIHDRALEALKAHNEALAAHKNLLNARSKRDQEAILKSSLSPFPKDRELAAKVRAAKTDITEKSKDAEVKSLEYEKAVESESAQSQKDSSQSLTESKLSQGPEEDARSQSRKSSRSSQSSGTSQSRFTEFSENFRKTREKALNSPDIKESMEDNEKRSKAAEKYKEREAKLRASEKAMAEASMKAKEIEAAKMAEVERRATEAADKVKREKLEKEKQKWDELVAAENAKKSQNR
ncbi:unnamed protein product [Sphagnum tenellum]